MKIYWKNDEPAKTTLLCQMERKKVESKSSSHHTHCKCEQWNNTAW